MPYLHNFTTDKLLTLCKRLKFFSEINLDNLTNCKKSLGPFQSMPICQEYVEN